jgi:DNA-binding MarR family transcriptional regulator
MGRYKDFTRSASGPLIGALLRRPVGVLRTRILADLAAQGFGDLHPTHLNVFQHPGPEGLRPSQLATAAGVTKQAMNHLLGQLESLGYLRRRPVRKGSRGTAISLTSRGDRAVAAIRRSIQRVEGEWAAALGIERFQTLRALLTDLETVLDQPRVATVLTSPRRPRSRSKTN